MQKHQQKKKRETLYFPIRLWRKKSALSRSLARFMSWQKGKVKEKEKKSTSASMNNYDFSFVIWIELFVYLHVNSLEKIPENPKNCGEQSVRHC